MAAARPPPDTPELSDEGSSDDPRIEDVEGVFEMEEGQELGEEEGDEEDEEEEEEEPDYFRDDDPSLHHLRNINALASFHVSTHKPSCGVPALLFPSATQYWQSDGPQPHTLTVHFFKQVLVRKLRLLLDFRLDESYTPTKMQFVAGTGEHDLVEFARWEGERPRGWVDVDVSGCGRGRGGNDHGGDGDGDGVWCMLLQVLVLENHQNGKDTHVRGVQVFAKDERGREDREVERRMAEEEEEEEEEGRDGVWVLGGKKGVGKMRKKGRGKSLFDLVGLGGDDEPEWMKEPQIR